MPTNRQTSAATTQARMRMNCYLQHWERVSVSRCRCMPQGNSGPFTRCVLRCRTRKLSRTAIVKAKLGLRWWIEFRCGSLSPESYPRINLTDWCRSPRDVRFTACWFRGCRFKQRATIPPLTLPEDDVSRWIVWGLPSQGRPPTRRERWPAEDAVLRRPFADVLGGSPFGLV